MKITLILVGKTDKDYFVKAVEEYTKRVSRYCKFEIKVIPELRNTKSMSIDVQMQKEAESILPLIQNAQEIILLDEHGQEFNSVDFARFIEKRMIAGQRDLFFVVGGPYGFAEKVKSVAHSKISLSKLTYSHQLVRLVFVEQLYRAFTIIKGEPYHHQ
ncbi:ribosomal RNA large subunit methyltransferase H [Tenuifilaceae bacterium CYCD]|nr:ribosomal RNA large subunit methyltransferase H [Tenuifilaceae bacterium CYCD]